MNVGPPAFFLQHDPENDSLCSLCETSACLPMCGHGTIGTITIAIEEGFDFHPKTPGFLKNGKPPAGLVLIEYKQEGEKGPNPSNWRCEELFGSRILKNWIGWPENSAWMWSYGGKFLLHRRLGKFPGIGTFSKPSNSSPWLEIFVQKWTIRYDIVHPEHEIESRIFSMCFWTGKT